MKPTVTQAIEQANAILPGKPVDDDIDPRWQAIIEVGEFITTNPEEIWTFVARWGKHQDEDLRMAISSILLEHLLEYHFELIFPLVQIAVKKDRLFAKTFSSCWKCGQSEDSKNEKSFDELKRWCNENGYK